jgi:MoaD family protein
LRVKVQYFAYIRELVNKREEILDVKDGISVGELLGALVELHGQKLKEQLFDSETGNPKPYLQFLVDETPILKLNGFSTRLSDESVFAVIPPVGGG